MFKIALTNEHICFDVLCAPEGKLKETNFRDLSRCANVSATLKIYFFASYVITYFFFHCTHVLFVPLSHLPSITSDLSKYLMDISKKPFVTLSAAASSTLHTFFYCYTTKRKLLFGKMLIFLLRILFVGWKGKIKRGKHIFTMPENCYVLKIKWTFFFLLGELQ